MAKNYEVFISHSWDYVDDLKRLRTLLENRGYFNVNFNEVAPEDAIDSTNSAYVKSVLSTKIANSDIVLGIAGIYASYSDWMQWELDKALEKEKPILGVIPWGQEHVSSVVCSRANEIVRWNTESIVDAIRRLA